MSHVLHDNEFHSMAFLHGRKMSHHKMADGNPIFSIMMIIKIKERKNLLIKP
jgi:hypothetical protein